jgi:hypothetical protein
LAAYEEGQTNCVCEDSHKNNSKILRPIVKIPARQFSFWLQGGDQEPVKTGTPNAFEREFTGSKIPPSGDLKPKGELLSDVKIIDGGGVRVSIVLGSASPGNPTSLTPKS